MEQRIVQHLCISAAALLWPHSPPTHPPSLDQGRSAIKDACPSVKREKKEPLIHIAPGEDCAPPARETKTPLLGKQTLHPWRSVSTFGDAVGNVGCAYPLPCLWGGIQE